KVSKSDSQAAGFAVLLVLSVIALLTVTAGGGGPQSPWQPIDNAVTAAVDRGELPGAVVLVLHEGKVVFRKAYGRRSQQPQPTLMEEDTVFDLASLTKPIVTATA